jgi:hypothetical protein
MHKGHGRLAGGQVVQVAGGGKVERGQGILRLAAVDQVDVVVLDQSDINMQIVLLMDLLDIGLDTLDDIGLLQERMGQGNGPDT